MKPGRPSNGTSWRRTALGRLAGLSSRGTPRLQRLYAQLPESAGLAPGADQAEQEARLRRYYAYLRDHVPDLPDPPTFSLLIEDPSADPQLLAETISSIRLQVWPHWQVCAATPANVPLVDPLARLAADHPDQIRRVDAGNDPDAGARDACWAATGDYVAVISAGDRLYPSALAEMVRAIDLERRLTDTTPMVLYSDERTINSAGVMTGDPVFKPGWSPRLLRSGDYVGALTMYRSDLLCELGGPRTGAVGRHSLALEAGRSRAFIHVPHVLVQRRRGPVMKPAADPPAVDVRASVVIPTRDQPDLLSACVASVRDRTRHPDFEIILVDNGSRDRRALALMSELERDDRIQVVRRPGPFNFARLCNEGVRRSSGEVVVLLNNDTEVLSSSWLSTLVSHCCEPGTGAVGPQLRYPDGTIQHAGLAGMADAGTGHLFVARDPAAESPLCLASAAREVLAVTGACLAVRRDTYVSIGGLDEAVVPNDSGDVDLCLRLREAGLVNVYAPSALLLHHESPSRGRSFVAFERYYLQRRWPAELLADPYLNPNLARSSRYEADPRFGVAEVPSDLFHRWLAAGTLGTGEGVNDVSG